MPHSFHDNVEKDLKTQLNLLQIAHEESKFIRRQNERLLLIQKDTLQNIVRKKICETRISDEKYTRKKLFHLNEVQSNMLNTSLNFRKEADMLQKRMLEELQVIESGLKQKRVEANIKRNLSLFSLHVERETDDAVRFINIPKLSNDYIRCEEAIQCQSNLQHIDLDVIQIYRTDNRALSDRFQEKVRMLDTEKQLQYKIKGLFCKVSDNSLERLIVYGFGNEQSSWPQGKTLYDLWINNDQTKLDNIVDDCGYAKEQCERCEAPDFPCLFSSKCFFPPKHRTVKNDRVSKHEYLLLSKVIVDCGKQSSSGLCLFHSINAMTLLKHFSQTQFFLEYWIENDACVLPQFLIHYKQKSKAAEKESKEEITCNVSVVIFKIL